MIRERSDGFGEKAEALDEDGNFAALGFDNFASGFHKVAEVDEVEFGVTEISRGGVGGLDELAAEEELDFAGLVLNMTKTEGALLAPGDKAARDGDLLIFVLREVVQDGFGEMGAFALGRVGIEI